MSNPNRRWKRLLAGFVAVVMGASLLAIAPAGAQVSTDEFCENVSDESPFTDVSDANEDVDGIENAANILCLAASEITVGVTPTTYEPGSNVSRRQMALFIKRLIDKANELEITDLAELPAYDGTPDFSDLPGDPPEEDVFLEAIGQLDQAGIIDGLLDGTYNPNGNVTRGQMAKFIANAIEFLTGEELADGDDAFTDDDTSVFEMFINELFEAGVVVGRPNGDYEPLEFVSRRQMASFLIRALAVLFNDGDIEALPGDGGEPDEDSITLDGTTVEQGDNITGTIADPSTVDQLRVTGCGLDEAVVIDGTTGDFSISIPDDATLGACTLTFTITRDGVTTTQEFPITITDPAAPPPPGGGGVEDASPIGTNGPDLIDARIVLFDITDGDREIVDYCFDEAIATLGPANRFELQGVESDDDNEALPNQTAVGGTPSIVPGTNCVRVEFPSGTDLEQFTLAVAEDGAVADFGGIENVLDSTALDGSTLAEFVGRTVGPDLVDTEIDSALNRITFIFDEAIANVDNPEIGAFHFFTAAGTRFNAIGFTRTANTVRVFFAPGVDVDDAARIGLDRGPAGGNGVVQDFNGNGNPEGVDLSVTSRPDLISVEPGPAKSQFDFTFDESVVVFNQNGFRLYFDDPDFSPATVVSAVNLDSDTIRVTFAVPIGLTDFPNEAVVLATVTDGSFPGTVSAVNAIGAPLERNTTGAIGIAQVNQGPGFTNGPDLQSATFAVVPDQVTFTFDEVLSEVFLGSANAFAVVDAAGNLTRGTAIIDVNGEARQATVQFPAGSVSNAVGALVDNPLSDSGPGDIMTVAVFDEFLNPNSPNAVGGGPVAP